MLLCWPCCLFVCLFVCLFAVCFCFCFVLPWLILRRFVALQFQRCFVCGGGGGVFFCFVLFICFLLFSLVALIVFFVVFKFTVNVYTGRAFCGRLKPPCLSSPPFFAPTQKWNLPWWRSRSIIGWGL